MDVFAAFRDWPDPIFLDSSLVHQHLGRYSYLAADPFLVLSCKNGQVSIRERGRSARVLARCDAQPAPVTGSTANVCSDPLAHLQRLLRLHRSERLPGLPPFQGGAIGYFGYDLGRYLEMLPSVAADDLGMPDLCVGLYAWVLAHHHQRGRTWLIVNPVDGGRQAAAERLAEIGGRIAAVRPTEARRLNAMLASLPGIRSNFTRDAYLHAVAAAKEYIASGDIYQVCLSQRLTVDLDLDPWQLYLRLRAASPVTYGAYLGFAEAKVASVSPELFLRLEGNQIETRPIKGTRPRGRTLEEDAGLAADLRSSEKDQAENVMIVDLLRNDLGRVSRTGTVRVPTLFDLETYSTVHHLVSTVQGELRPELDAVDLLRACFPGGSVTGCPKIRAMEIIEELEPTRRGPYCGSIGFISFGGDMDTSIAIRTALHVGGQVHYQVGGAIVADSDPAAEYQETLDKARAFLLALGVAEFDNWRWIRS